MRGPPWFPDWSGDAAVVVAGGESAKDADLESVRGKARVLVINNAWQLAPWADALYAGDQMWWYHYGPSINFAGLLIANGRDPGFGNQLVLVRRSVDRFILDEPGVIGHGANSGFQGLNLAAQFGARRIALVGFDFCGSHWHGAHARPLGNPDEAKFRLWLGHMEAAGPGLLEHGIDVVNCSPISLLTCFRRASLAEFLGG